MLGLKDNTTGNQKPTSEFPATASAAQSSKPPLLAKAARWRPALLGLDIGSTAIKAVLLHRPHGRITLKQAAIAPTPRDAVTEGTLTDGIEIALELKRLFKDFRIRARQVAVAVGGDKVYCQCDSVSDEDDLGLHEMVRRAAEKALPYPVENALLDYHPVGADADGAPSEVLWVSSPAEQVEWLRETVVLAGRKAAFVDVQACALANAFAHSREPEANSPCVLLHVSAGHLIVCLMKGRTLRFARHVSIARRQITLAPSSLPERVLAQVDGFWEELAQMAAPDGLQSIYLSGGAVGSDQLEEALHEQLGLPVYQLDPMRNISYSPSSDAGKLVETQKPAMTLAIGLALRGFPDHDRD